MKALKAMNIDKLAILQRITGLKANKFTVNRSQKSFIFHF